MTRARALKHSLIALAALSFGGALGSSAWAGDAGCFWDKLPQAGRDRFVAGFPDTMGEKTADALGGGDAIIAAIKGCGVADAGNNDVLVAFTGEAMMRGAALRIKADYGVDESLLRDAWMAMPATERKAVCDDAADVGEATAHTAPESEATVNRYLERLALKDDKAQDLAAGWVVGMCMKANGEAKF